jgi:hypothetical protein
MQNAVNTTPPQFYIREFPDFDNGEAFETMLSMLKAYGFEDYSWHNDACPSMALELANENTIRVWCDYKDDALREDASITELYSVVICDVASAQFNTTTRAINYVATVLAAIRFNPNNPPE